MENQNKKALILSLTGFAAIGGAAVLGISILKGKNVNLAPTSNKIPFRLLTLKDVVFNKGIATQNGSKFTGRIKYTIIAVIK